MALNQFGGERFSAIAASSNYAVNKAKAEKFARDAKLKSQQLDYLPSDGNS